MMLTAEHVSIIGQSALTTEWPRKTGQYFHLSVLRQSDFNDFFYKLFR